MSTKISNMKQILEKQQSVQALVLADDFSTSLLSPLQDIFPSILTPVANVNLLDSIVLTLIRSDIKEMFIYCSSHIELLKNYISMKRYDNIAVSLILSDGCRSLGDALRDIDTKGLIRGDFILIRGDAFISTNLSTLLLNHQARKNKDKGIAMSVVFRNIGSSKHSSLAYDSCLYVVNKQTDRLIFYKPKHEDSLEKKQKFDLDWFLNYEQVQINTGVIDTHVYMCSQTVLSLFSDNFDFQTMDDFIKGVLLNEEIIEARIYQEVLGAEEYALPISSWSAYNTLTRDFLQRQSYPLTPDMLAPSNDVVYSSKSIYKNKSSSLARGCILEKNSSVGRNCQLGNNSHVSRSTIGNNCKIGDNVVIHNCHIFDDVTINDNCNIKHCCIFSKCNLSPDTQINACVILEKSNVPTDNYSKNILQTVDGKIKATDLTKVKDGDKFLRFSRINEHEEDNSDNDNDDDDSSVLEELSSKRSEQSPDEILDDTHIFLTEVIDSLLRAYQDKLNCENIILEINSSRYAYNVGMRDVTNNVIKAILLLPMHYLREEKISVDYSSYQTTIRAMITYFTPIIQNYVKTDDAQKDCLSAIEEIAGSNEFVMKFALQLVGIFYKKDILSEDKIIEWYNADNGNDDDDEDDNVDGFYNEEVRKVIQPFIKWLNEAEEDSSDED